LLLNSDHAIAPKLSITSNNDTPVVHDDHAPTLPVNEDAAIATTQIVVATQNTTVSTNSRVFSRR
jgi:hypothetical protein